VIDRVLYLFFCTRIKTCDCFFVFLPQSLPRAPASSRNKVYCWNLTESIVQTVAHQICLALLRDNSEWNIIFYFINLEMMKLEEENCPLLHSRPDFWNQHLTEAWSSSRKPIIWHPSMSRMIFEVALKLMSFLPLPLLVFGIQTLDCQLAKWIRTWNGEILGLGKWSTSWVNFCCLLPSRERGNISHQTGSWLKSAGWVWGFVIVPRKVFFIP